MAETDSAPVQAVQAVADTAENTVDAAHRAALALALPIIKQARDLVGVAQAGVDLAQASANKVVDFGQMTVDEFMDQIQKFVETGERPS